MPSSIDIASNALLLVGDNPISSFTEPGAGAQAAANLYQPTKERLLSFHFWTFAKKQQELNLLSETPPRLSDWTYIYQLPTDVIRIWRVQPHIDYEIIGDKIHCNEGSGLLLTYVYDVDEAKLPADAVKALEYLLASELAISVTEDENKAQLYEQKGRQELAKASTSDSQSAPQMSIVDSPFVDARGAGIY